MTVVENPQRKRFRPEVRRAMILDEAAHLIVHEGIAGLTLERIAREAGVSKSLIYNYFDGVTELLKELYDRELKRLRHLQFKAAEAATTFEDMVRGITHEYLKYIEERGLVIERLQAEPSVAQGRDPTYYDRRPSVEYMAGLVARIFDMPMDFAIAATEVSYGLPASAGEFLLRDEMDRDALEDLTVSMIVGAVLKARNDYLAKNRPLRPEKIDRES